MVNIAFCEHPEKRGRVIKVLTCDCGQEFELVDWWAEACPGCGQEYNGAGQKLAPRSQWGEETGETFIEGEKIIQKYDPKYDGGLEPGGNVVHHVGAPGIGTMTYQVTKVDREGGYIWGFLINDSSRILDPSEVI